MATSSPTVLLGVIRPEELSAAKAGEQASRADDGAPASSGGGVPAGVPTDKSRTIIVGGPSGSAPSGPVTVGRSPTPVPPTAMRVPTPPPPSTVVGSGRIATPPFPTPGTSASSGVIDAPRATRSTAPAFALSGEPPRSGRPPEGARSASQQVLVPVVGPGVAGPARPGEFVSHPVASVTASVSATAGQTRVITQVRQVVSSTMPASAVEAQLRDVVPDQALTRLASAGAQLVRASMPSMMGAIAPPPVHSTSVVLPETVHPALVLLQKDQSDRAASFRILRRRLIEQDDPRVILVTSAHEEEGKTTCAVNLALAMAESGHRRVLLVEASTGRPKLAEIFGLNRPDCLLSQLAARRGQVGTAWRTTEIQPVGLHVLAVAPDASTDESLHAPTFTAAAGDWRLAFDYVVVDGPALLSSSNASIIQDAVDAVVVVVRSGKTRHRALRGALNQISKDKVAGLVLMDGLS